MTGSLQEEYIITELDPDILVTSCEVLTNWHVLTGAACSGKTTLIDMLAGRGFQTVAESGRQYMQAEMAKGRCFDDIFGNAADEIKMKCLQESIERGLDAADVIFLDRALPDCLTFCRLCGLDPHEILADCLRFRYASVFVLDRLPFERDEVRMDEDIATRFVDEWLARDYGALGYDVVRLPVLEPEERLAALLDCLGAQGLL